MDFNNQDLIEAFYSLHKQDYPDLTLEELKLICHTPWLHAKRQMEREELPVIRLKYFGTFQVYKGKANLELRKLEEKLKKGTISQEKYDKIKPILENYIKS